jgi:hypothetical protein
VDSTWPGLSFIGNALLESGSRGGEEVRKDLRGCTGHCATPCFEPTPPAFAEAFAVLLKSAVAINALVGVDDSAVLRDAK